MIVLDSSAVVEILTNGSLGDLIQRALDSTDGDWAAPHLIDLEVANVLRRLPAVNRLEPHRLEQMLFRLQEFPVERHAHVSLLPRIWELRHNFNAYDAAYVALAEELNGTLFTCDAKLRKGHRAKVQLFQEI